MGDTYTFVDDRAIRDFDNEAAPASNFLLVPADGNDFEILSSLLEAAVEWAGEITPYEHNIDDLDRLLSIVRIAYLQPAPA